ncbi:MAG: acyl-CoA dehydrogenase family protein [Deltaproteobacteria bacterium]|nr:acyl-CoA dehydrogenase family protein [Deltaproteobacteria bacterium]
MIDYSRFQSAVGLNWYEIDANLRNLLLHRLEPEDFEWCDPELARIGALVGGPIAERAEITDKNPPRLVKFDRWGEEVDAVVHHPAAVATKRDAWTAGISGPRLRLEAARRGRRYPELVGAGLNYLLAQADIGMLCAVGMTSGVIGLVKRYGPPGVRDEALARLTAEEFDQAWDGAMFMTERSGGSDLGTLATTARAAGDHWLLNGSKWFCSNVDAAAIVTLARPEGAAQGIKGVAPFLVLARRRDGRRNGISIRRLKDKLGTRSVPTAEVDFVDAEAYLLADSDGAAQGGRDGRGINRMMEMVNSSRHGVAVMGLGVMRRAFVESAIFAAQRTAFGRRLWELPMMRETLVGMAVELEATAALVFEAAQSEADSRLLTALAKLRATRRGVETASQALEVHGGNGYIEDWPLARLLRDAQANPVWEGTENIICLDVLRALRSEKVMQSALARLHGVLEAAVPELGGLRAVLARSLEEAVEALGFLAGCERDLAELRARGFANYLADLFEAALLLEEAAWELERSGNARKAVVAALFIKRRLVVPAGRGIASADRTLLDLFEPLVGYGEVTWAQARRAISLT